MAQAKVLNTSNSVRHKSKPTTNTSAKSCSSKAATPCTKPPTSTLGATKVTQPHRTVFKPVLDNPFQIEWPPLPSSLRNRLLDLLTEALRPTTTTTTTTAAGAAQAHEIEQDLSISEWREALHKNKRELGSKTRRQSKRQRKRAASVSVEDKGKDKDVGDGQHPTSERKPPKAKKARIDSSAAATSTLAATAPGDRAPPPPQPQPSTSSSEATHTLTLRSSKTVTVPNFVDKPLVSSTTTPSKQAALPRKPKMLDSLVVGINDLTRALESRIRWARWELGDLDAAPRLRMEKGKHVEVDVSDKLDKGKDKADRPSKNRRKNRPKAADDDARWDEIVLGPQMTQEQKEVVDEPYRFLLNPLQTDSLDLDEASYIRRFAGADNVASLTFPKILNNSLAFRIKSLRTQVPPPASSDPALSKDKNGNKNKKKPSTHAKPPPRKTEQSDPYYPLIDLVFVCKPDINPVSLVGHLPTMCAAANGLQKAVSVERKRRKEQTKGKGKETDRADGDGDEDGMDVEEVAQAEVEEQDRFVYLIPLDVGAEHRLAEIMGLRRVAAIGVCSSSTSTFAPLLSLVQDHLQPLFVPWLNPSPKSVPSGTTSTVLPGSEPKFIPTHIKHLKTTQPLNPRAAHALKKEGKKKTREMRREIMMKKDGKGGGKEGGEEVYVVDEDMYY
ncbi:BQ2448_940 [Microbotryum intermedium]|uniref:BQ2448_940 protein n=1 Tax=Microbotryum intermedium TaxID=269621 RepID=A0A238F7T8_9BASI|nr:BQ2448_940 [Microbotryum intermedium]